MSSNKDHEGQLAMVDPMPIYFTFSRIRPQFSCGRFVKDTLDELLNGTISVRDLPSIAVLTDGEHMYSLNNRRLFVFKELHKAGLLQEVPVRLRPVPQTKRMAEKYTPAKCALVATLKGQGHRGGPADPEDDRDAGSEQSDEEESVRAPKGRRASDAGTRKVAELPERHDGVAQSTVAKAPIAANSRTAAKAAKRAARKNQHQHGHDSDSGDAPPHPQSTHPQRHAGAHDLAAELAGLHGGDGSDSDSGRGKTRGAKGHAHK
jgi:hypothetical protein